MCKSEVSHSIKEVHFKPLGFCSFGHVSYLPKTEILSMNTGQSFGYPHGSWGVCCLEHQSLVSLMVNCSQRKCETKTLMKKRPQKAGYTVLNREIRAPSLSQAWPGYFYAHENELWDKINLLFLRASKELHTAWSTIDWKLLLNLEELYF